MRGDPRRLTPLRALELMREADRVAAVLRATSNDGRAPSCLERVASALADHVRAELTKKRRRARRG